MRYTFLRRRKFLETIQYKCPNCGGPLEYRADIRQFGCEYCLSTFTDEEVKKMFKDNESADLSQNTDESAEDDGFGNGNLYSCTSCGAEIMTDAETAATFCVYCHNPVILKGRLSGEYRPGSVLPFEINRDKALEIFKKEMGRKKFTPSDFLSTQTLEKMTGLYVPFWLADCQANGNLEGIGKIIRTWRKGDYQFTETKEYTVERVASITCRGVPADGASKIDDSLMDAVEPFDYSKMEDFSMSYLSGFLADRYDVNKGEVFPRIREKVNTASKELLRASVTGYNSFSESKSSVNIMNTDWRYALLPVWFMTYKYNGKIYEFAVNGQSGKLAGFAPLSKKKLCVFGILLFLAITLIAGLGGYFL